MYNSHVPRSDTRDPAVPPALFQLSGHEVRWRLLQELAASDRQVRELSALVGQRQSLTSYHLGALRKGGLVSARRSSADLRDTYYSLDLAAFGSALVDAGAALHPGFRPVMSGPGAPWAGGDRPTGMAPARVIFLCSGNSARSQMAEAIMGSIGGSAVHAVSAGLSPKELHPAAVAVMRERGIDISGRRAKHLDEFAGQRFDYAITLCDRVREACPDLPQAAATTFWSIADPAVEPRSGDDLAPFVRAADELTVRIGFLFQRIEHAKTTSERS